MDARSPVDTWTSHVEIAMDHVRRFQSLSFVNLCFYQVICKLWSGEYESFPSRNLKSVISKRSEHFGGYQQQDAHEFMSYLLDGLHEDLNRDRVKTKPITPAVEGNGRPDVEVENDNWVVHKKRNDSFLVGSVQVHPRLSDL